MHGRFRRWTSKYGWRAGVAVMHETLGEIRYTFEATLISFL